MVLFAHSQISNHGVVMKHLELLKVEKLYFVCELKSRPSNVFRNKDFILYEEKKLIFIISYNKIVLGQRDGNCYLETVMPKLST